MDCDVFVRGKDVYWIHDVFIVFFTISRFDTLYFLSLLAAATAQLRSWPKEQAKKAIFWVTWCRII